MLGDNVISSKLNLNVNTNRCGILCVDECIRESLLFEIMLSFMGRKLASRSTATFCVSMSSQKLNNESSDNSEDITAKKTKKKGCRASKGDRFFLIGGDTLSIEFSDVSYSALVRLLAVAVATTFIVASLARESEAEARHPRKTAILPLNT